MRWLLVTTLLLCAYALVLWRSRKGRPIPEHKVIARSGSPADLENFSVTVKTSDGKMIELRFTTCFNVTMKPEKLTDGDIQVGDWLFFRPHDHYTWSDTVRVRTKFKDGFPVPNLHLLSAL